MPSVALGEQLDRVGKEHLVSKVYPAVGSHYRSIDGGSTDHAKVVGTTSFSTGRLWGAAGVSWAEAGR